MKITLTPQLRADTLSLSSQSDVLTVNGTEYDFTPLAEGATLPRAAVTLNLLASDVTRIDGEVCLSLILPHGPDAPPEALFPQPVTVTEPGPIPLPVTYPLEDQA